MSMTLKIGYTDDKPTKLSKTATWVLELTGELKEGCSLMSPVIKISSDAAAIAGCNYMYISDFGRYYYIDDISAIAGNMAQVAGRVDVLTTYDSQIRDCWGIVKRNETNFNLYMNDDIFKVYQNDLIGYKKFSTGFSSFANVLVVAGGAPATP